MAKFLVPLTIFLSASLGKAFGSLSSAAGVRVNHLTRLQQPMSDPTNEPSCEPVRELNKQLGQDVLLSVNLSSKNGEGEVHSEAVSTNVESPHDATRVKRVTFSDERMMRSKARVLLSLILDKMNGECLIKSILIPVVYDA